jgi:thioredoxin 1
MNQPTNQDRFSPPWLLIVGLLLGGSLIVFMTWDSISGSFKQDRRGAVSSNLIVHLTNDNWQQEVVESKIPVLVDFTADWCGPCKNFAPVIDRLAERYQGKLKVASFDVGDTSFHKARKQAAQYGIDGIPCVMIFKGGDEPRFQKGGPSEAELIRAIDRVLQ